jgi:hypothetical protein
LVVDSRICLFHRLRFFSVFCIIFVTLDSFLGDRYFGRKASATRIPGKDHWHQTAVTLFTENGPFQGYTRKTTLFRATQIFQKVTKFVVNSQINVSFSPAPIGLSLSLLNLKYYLTYQKKNCLNK